MNTVGQRTETGGAKLGSDRIWPINYWIRWRYDKWGMLTFTGACVWPLQGQLDGALAPQLLNHILELSFSKFWSTTLMVKLKSYGKVTLQVTQWVKHLHQYEGRRERQECALFGLCGMVSCSSSLCGKLCPTEAFTVNCMKKQALDGIETLYNLSSMLKHQTKSPFTRQQFLVLRCITFWSPVYTEMSF